MYKNFICRLFITSILIFALNSPVDAQVCHSYFKNYSISDGLPDNVIHSVFQDSKGWIWMATNNGVVRFDGYNFKQFSISGITGDLLNKSLVRIIFEDKKGILWFGTEKEGVFLYDRQQYTLFHIPSLAKGSSVIKNSVWSIAGDHEGNIWVATEDGIVQYKSGQLSDYLKGTQPFSVKLQNTNIRCLYPDGAFLWVGTILGIARVNLQNRDVKYYLQKNKVNRENEVCTFCKSSDGQFWAGTYLGGLKRYDKTTDSFENVIFDASNERSRTVRAIVEDKRHVLWIGTRGGLYSRSLTGLNIGHFEQQRLENNGLAHNSVLCLLNDKKGDLWIGTRNGISFMDFEKQAFGYLPAGSEKGKVLNHHEVYALWEDPSGLLWIGTENGGINIFDKKTGIVRYITQKDGLSNNCIKALSPDGFGNMLVGTYLGGLNKYNLLHKTTEHFIYSAKDSQSISGNAVWAILRDHKNRIWVGTDGGVDLFNSVSGKFYRLGGRYKLENIVMIAEDSKGRIWLYHENVNMAVIDSMGVKIDLPYRARAILDDGNNIWLGTLGNGLVKLSYDLKEMAVYTSGNGLCSNYIYGILKGRQGELWLSTKNGMACFQKEIPGFSSYSVADGLLNEQYNYGAFLKANDGGLVFGGDKGVDFISPVHLQQTNYITPLVLTDFKIFNNSVPVSLSGKTSVLSNFISETRLIKLKYQVNTITFEFAALNYNNRLRNNYWYRLQGFDASWNNVKGQRTATYTNLEPGNYTFLVQEGDSEKQLGKQSAMVHLVILPPLYKTWYFRVFILVALLALFYAVFSFLINREKLRHQLLRERQSAREMQELERLKHQFFMNVSHEIRTPLTLIISPLEKIMSSEMSKDAIMGHLGIIKRNTTLLMRLINQLLDYRKIETGNIQLELKRGNISDFIQNIVMSFNSVAAEKNIHLHFKTLEDGIYTSFDADNIEKIVNNLISNALKFTGEKGSVSIILSLVSAQDFENEDCFVPLPDKDKMEVKQFVQIIVRDSGIGIPASQVDKIFNRFLQVSNNTGKSNAGSGIGLNLTKELVKLHHGYIQVQSREGKGSKFTVFIPYLDDNKLDIAGKTIAITGFESSEKETGTGVQEREVITTHSSIPILLLVDDNADIRTFVRHHFESSYQVIEAVNGKIAWEKALEFIPDLIIADVMMPEIDGFELCRKVKKDERTSHIPYIMLTALTSKEKQISGIDTGADDFITKPFDVSLLKAKADNILAIRKSLRERYSKEFMLRPKDIILTSPDEKFLKKITGVIEQNMDNPEFDIENLVQHAGVSRTQLFRKIAALTDMSPKEFVRDFRLRRASQLILQDKLTISEVSLEVGFSDVNYFRKNFKEKFGMSATEFLRTYASRE